MYESNYFFFPAWPDQNHFTFDNSVWLCPYHIMSVKIIQQNRRTFGKILWAPRSEKFSFPKMVCCVAVTAMSVAAAALLCLGSSCCTYIMIRECEERRCTPGFICSIMNRRRENMNRWNNSCNIYLWKLFFVDCTDIKLKVSFDLLESKFSLYFDYFIFNQ